jgi:hypothetical protein
VSFIAALQTVTAISILGHAELTRLRLFHLCASILAFSVMYARQGVAAFVMILTFLVSFSALLVHRAISFLAILHHTLETFIARKIVVTETGFLFL